MKPFSQLVGRVKKSGDERFSRQSPHYENDRGAVTTVDQLKNPQILRLQTTSIMLAVSYLRSLSEDLVLSLEGLIIVSCD